MIHIGQLIREELDRQGRSVGWLAKQLGRSRSVVYRLCCEQQFGHGGRCEHLAHLASRFL
ncbi:hypothetical protein AAAT34_01070 [Hallella faecis]|uniref:Helix-turn-helix domain-containing protein n=1 Tax=Hallella faecis TaxID=2841596 RepID=A0ABV1FMS8_9BACT|nr:MULTISPECIES: hypothetical protein [Hallella]MDD7146462.1 hypothetical protein [Hallella sp.]